MTHRRKLVLAALVVVSALFLAALAVATSIATGLLPAWTWLHDARVMWLVVAGLAVTVAVLAVIERRLASHDSSTPAAAPADTPPVAVPEDTPPVTVAETRPGGLPARDFDFTGRESLLAELGQSLAAGPVAVVGIGGVGKSSLVLEYAHRGQADGRYTIAWWVRAGSPLTLVEDMARLAEALGVPAEADQEEMIRKAHQQLAQRSDWLVVFDGAPDAAAIRDRLPSGQGHVIITSRDRQWDEVARPFDVTVFDPAESVAFLLRNHKRGHETAVAATLAETLGHLPLALALAATYLAHHNDLSIAAYLERYLEREADGRTLATKIGEYPHPVATTWLLHYEELRKQPAGLQLLKLCSHLAPDDINLELLLSQPDVLAGPLTGDLATAVESAAGREEVVATLARTGLVGRIDGGSRVRLHRLVAEVTRHSLDDPPAWAKRAMSLLVTLIPKQPREPQRWSECADLAAHVETADAAGAPAVLTAHVLVWLGHYLGARGRYVEAKRHFARALRIKGELYGPDHEGVASTLTNLAVVQIRLEEYSAALEGLQWALRIEEAVYGPEHDDLEATLNNLGIVQLALGMYAEAAETFPRALHIKEAKYGPDHPEVAKVLANLGFAQSQLGQSSAAADNLRRALHIYEQKLPADHPKIKDTQEQLQKLESAQPSS